MDGTIGEIRLFAGNFAPRNWAYCQGQLMPISGNEALFSVVGTSYGGDGRTTFSLPDLRGRVPVGTGSGPGLTYRALGQMTGAETTTLAVTNLPAHNHPVTVNVSIPASGDEGDSEEPGGNVMAVAEEGTPYQTSPDGSTTMAAPTVTATAGNTGGGTPANNMQPSLGLNYIICLYGVYPSRE